MINMQSLKYLALLDHKYLEHKRIFESTSHDLGLSNNNNKGNIKTLKLNQGV
jgi:hypothetical protein